jgi:hypothetical protein
MRTGMAVIGHRAAANPADCFDGAGMGDDMVAHVQLFHRDFPAIGEDHGAGAEARRVRTGQGKDVLGPGVRAIQQDEAAVVGVQIIFLAADVKQQASEVDAIGVAGVAGARGGENGIVVNERAVVGNGALSA